MKTRRYKLRISGLREDEGKIKMATLQRVVDAFLTTAERTTRLLATGTGSGKGARPQWLNDTIDFTIVGMKPGSTIIDIEAPQLGETACEQFAQADLWIKQPGLDETAADLAAKSINEIQVPDPVGDYFDSSVLQAILKFRKAAGVAGVRYEMIPHSTADEGFSLDENTCEYIKERLNDIPAPKSFVVSGRLDEIKHGNGRFRLLVSRKSALFGRLDTAALSLEALRPLWGKQTTVEGMVHFKANGEPRFIEARRISSQIEGDNVSEEMPSAEIRKSKDLFPVQRKQAGAFDPIELAGGWPGDEPIEELLAQLD